MDLKWSNVAFVDASNLIFAVGDEDARVGSDIFIKSFSDMGIGRDIVSQAELPMWVELGLDRFDHLAQPVFSGIVDWLSMIKGNENHEWTGINTNERGNE